MINEYFDLAQVMLYLFWIFFAGLLLYLRREDRREGYPLESDTATGRLLKPSLIFFPAPKIFALPHGEGTTFAPTGQADRRELAARPVARWPGAPLQPTDALPLLAGVGPGAWAERADRLDLTIEGHPKIVPLRAAPTFFPAPDGPDPRGFKVVGLDRAVAGRVVELWIDRSESALRYLEVALVDVASDGKATAGTPTRLGEGFEAKADARPAEHSTITGRRADIVPLAGASSGIAADGPGARTVLVPVTFANIHARRRTVVVKALLARQLAMAPQPANRDEVTMLEEEKIVGFFGAGLLYATPRRGEPLL